MPIKVPVRTAPYVMISSDYSQQEPKLTAFVSQDDKMIESFKAGRDIYATIASLAFNLPYEKCLEFHPETGEYQADGKARRGEAKFSVLGITYGRSVASVGEQLYGTDKSMTDEEKTREAQKVYDAVLNAFQALRRLMEQSQSFAHHYGYVETILGRRRHLPDMMLDEFEFEPLPGYVNPNIDPMDPSTFTEDAGIPESRLKELQLEFSKYKYFGQVAKRTKELYEKEHIKVKNNRAKINDAKRQCVNCVDSLTEILTLDGWKFNNEINVGDEILSYDIDSNQIVKDQVLEIHRYKSSENNNGEPYKCLDLSTSAFNTVCTEDHNWVMRNFDTDQVRVFPAERIMRFHRPRYHILRMVDNNVFENVEDTLKFEVDVLKLVNDIRFGSVEIPDLFKLSKHDATQVYDYFKAHIAKQGNVLFKSGKSADAFQIIAILAGKVSNKREQVVFHKKSENELVYRVTCSKRDMHNTARLDLMKKEEVTRDFVWCETTNSHTWIARRNGQYYITGNSIIQGSAADFSKSALIKVSTDPRWQAVGGEVLTIVHDEIVAQAPIDTWEEAANILKEDMESSGNFLPFPIKCDVEVSYRWYGLEAPCKYTKPESLDNIDEEGLKWVQYHLVELGYELPTFKDSEGNAPIGDAAHGISGIDSPEFQQAIITYCNRYNVPLNEFIDDIETRVEYTG